MKSLILSFLLVAILIGCSSSKTSTDLNLSKHNAVSIYKNLDSLNWFHKGIDENGNTGMFVSKWKMQNIQKLRSKEIIVAIIDSPLDINHDLIKNKLWINKAEIPNNGQDDDKNGYVDDVNGWNFIGTKDNGYLVFSNFEFVRILKEWGDLKTNQFVKKELGNEKEYVRALRKFKEQHFYYENWLKSLEYSVKTYPAAKDSLRHYFPNENYTYQQLDSMYIKHKINDKTFRQRREDLDFDLGAMIAFMKARLDFGEKSLKEVENSKQEVDSILNKSLNLKFNERLLIKDSSGKFEKGYGNNRLSTNIEGKTTTYNHSTKVSGIIAMIVSANVKIMPLIIASNGDEHDKDIAMAIRYAVDNGAKIINMSFGKEFALSNDLVYSAMKYAANHDILLIHGAGNDSFNVDENPNFPTDIDLQDGAKEVVGNFINVGASTAINDSTLVASFSNYGKKNVDLFAPGDQIYTSTGGNRYGYDSGTSLAAPMVSGTAALIWSYYPKLSAKQVKEIILESGTTYDLKVLIPGGEGKKVKFSELSKSGKVLNVYRGVHLFTYYNILI
ncbi:S8 family serine peptidase [Flavobacterium sp. CG_9.1]|uniref:S8 family serine peptidase n=1 Tax=Flavobacterium sp. CG_9.1 TaxID=2787728 RepID=UPI0018CBCDCD|nr:S8 family serine peptidase [Flavobacterium sp. CG_9.1]